MEYNWSIEKIRKHKQQIQYLLRTTEGLTKEDVEIIKENLKHLDYLEQILLPTNKKFTFPSVPKYMDKTHFILKSTYQEYQDIPLEIKKVILKTIQKFSNLDITYSDHELTNFNLSNQELVELSYEFFKWLPTKNKEYEKLFLRYTNPNNHLLHFMNHSISSSVNSEIIGSSSYFYFPVYRPYIAVTREYNNNDLCTLNHEIAHGIFYRMDNNKTLNSYHFFLTELEGFFFDFLTIQFLKEKGILNKDIVQLEYDIFSTQYLNFIKFYLTDRAIKLFESYKKVSIIPIQKDIYKNDLPIIIDETDLIAALQENPKNNARYLLSYFTNLDLEEIYYFDPEYAFYLFEGIRNFKTNNIFQNLTEHGITFMEDNYKNLQKKIKRINELGDRK